MAKLFNRAKMTTSTTGTGTITLGSASNGFQSFADAGVANGDVIQYVIEEGSNFEIGTGTYTASGTTLTRSPSESSNSDAAITLAGQATVSITAIHADFSRLQHEGSDKVTVSSTGASVTGNLEVTGTVDGVDIATRDGTLTSTTTTANAALPKSGGTMTGDIAMGDNVKAKFGAGDDLQIYHDASDSWIVDNGTGGLKIGVSGTGTSGFYKGTGSETIATFEPDGPVTLYHNNATKLATTSTGIDVTGNVTVSGTVDGRDLATDGSKLDGIAASANNYSLPLSSSSTRGGVKIGYTENGKNYPVELSSEKMYVNVPWTDNNTTYTAGSGLSLSGTTFSHSDTSTQASVNNSGSTFIQDITLDTYGHVTGITSATAAGVPSGVICMWSGTNANIPSGWYLCDGANGTPDLRDRFIVGSGSSYTTGNTGGAASVTLTTAQMPSHTHSGPSHSHTFSGTTSANGAYSFAARNSYSGWNGAAAGNGGQRYTLGAGNHTHTFSGTTSTASGTTGSAGSGNSHENRPPYYALAYIMKS